MRQLLRRLIHWLDHNKPDACSAAGWRSFQIGLVFLPTSALLAGLGILGAISLWRPEGQPRPLSRTLTRWLVVLSIWMVVTSIATPESLESKLRLFNWLPFFWLLLAAQPYLATVNSRERFATLIQIATVPALTIGLLQAMLLFSGPWSALGGLLNWDLPTSFAKYGAGVFPNPNFTAAWYAMVVPITAARALRPEAQRSWAWGLLTVLAFAVVVSGSRTALVGTTASVLVLAWRQFWKPVVTLVSIQTMLVAVDLTLPDHNQIGLLAQRLSGGLAHKLGAMLQGTEKSAADAIAAGRQPYRDQLFSQALDFIHAHPLLGLSEPLVGLQPVTPPALLTHTHNVAFQLSIQHGLPAAMLMVGIVLWALQKGWTRAHFMCDRALAISAAVAIWLNTYDIPSFDSRNNMLGWLLLTTCLTISSNNINPPESLR